MDTLSYERRKVYDLPLRLIHAWNALVILLLLATGWLSDFFEAGAPAAGLWNVHILAGYGLVAGLAARLTWGLVGPRHARFADLWHPRAWLAALRTRRLPHAPRFGHDPLASLVYLAVYIVLLGMAGTGLALAAVEHDMGPLAAWLGDSVWLKELFEEPHELGYGLLAGFVGLHLLALALHERFGRRPVAQAMVSGYQYRPSDASGVDHA